MQCLWLGEEGDLFREMLPASVLELVPEAEDDEKDEDENDDETDADDEEDEDEKKSARKVA